MAEYCTREDARAQGASADDARLDAAIDAAAALVDRYTGTFFSSRDCTLRVEIDPLAERMVALPAVARTVTQVMACDPDVVIPEAAWRVREERLYLPGPGVGNILVAGAEPWRGGYDHLLGPLCPRVIAVTGTFGPTTVPAPVAMATALLAAMIAPAPAVARTDEEGNPVGRPAGVAAGAGPKPEQVGPWGTDRGNAGRREDTTGLAAADRLLAPWRTRYRSRLKVG